MIRWPTYRHVIDMIQWAIFALFLFGAAYATWAWWRMPTTIATTAGVLAVPPPPVAPSPK
jgi:hypothetical protein